MNSQRTDCSPVTPTTRLEAFSDGVFAIAITLLVLEIKAPHPEPGAAYSLWAALADDWPAYIGYVVSFVTIGIYWVNHHYLLHLFRGTNHGLNLLNLLLLMCLSFLPFSTAVLGENLRQPGQERAAVAFYVLSFLAPAMAWFAMWRYAVAGGRLIDRNLEPAFIRKLTLRYGISSVVYPFALAADYWDYRAGLAIFTVITGMYLWPSPPPQYRNGAGEQVVDA